VSTRTYGRINDTVMELVWAQINGADLIYTDYRILVEQPNGQRDLYVFNSEALAKEAYDRAVKQLEKGAVHGSDG